MNPITPPPPQFYRSLMKNPCDLFIIPPVDFPLIDKDCFDIDTETLLNNSYSELVSIVSAWDKEPLENLMETYRENLEQYQFFNQDCNTLIPAHSELDQHFIDVSYQDYLMTFISLLDAISGTEVKDYIVLTGNIFEQEIKRIMGIDAKFDNESDAINYTNFKHDSVYDWVYLYSVNDRRYIIQYEPEQDYKGILSGLNLPRFNLK